MQPVDVRRRLRPEPSNIKARGVGRTGKCATFTFNRTARTWNLLLLVGCGRSRFVGEEGGAVGQPALPAPGSCVTNCGVPGQKPDVMLLNFDENGNGTIALNGGPTTPLTGTLV